METILVGAVARKGNKIIKQANISVDQAIELMLGVKDDATFPMLAMAELREGKTVKFKRDGYGVTLQPLHDHIDNY